MYQPAHFVESRPEVSAAPDPRASVRPARHRRRRAGSPPTACRSSSMPIPPAARACSAPTSPAPTRCGRRRAPTAIRWSSSRDRRATSRRPGIRARPSTARWCRPGTTSSSRGAGAVRFVDDREVAARLRHPADRGARGRPHGRRGRPRRAGLGGQRCAGRLCRDDAEGDRRRRDSADLAGRQVEDEPEPLRAPTATASPTAWRNGPEAKRRRWRRRCATPGTRRDPGRAARGVPPRRAPAPRRRAPAFADAVRRHHGAAHARLHRLPRAARAGPRPTATTRASPASPRATSTTSCSTFATAGAHYAADDEPAGAARRRVPARDRRSLRRASTCPTRRRAPLALPAADRARPPPAGGRRRRGARHAGLHRLPRRGADRRARRSCRACSACRATTSMPSSAPGATASGSPRRPTAWRRSRSSSRPTTIAP